MASAKQRVADVGQFDFFPSLLPPVPIEPAPAPAQSAIQPYYETKQTKPQPSSPFSLLPVPTVPAPIQAKSVKKAKPAQPRTQLVSSKQSKSKVIWPVPGLTVRAPEIGESGFGTPDGHLDEEPVSNGGEVKKLSEDDYLDEQLAELMFMRMKHDLSYLLVSDEEYERELIESFQEVDLFGSAAASVCHDRRMLDKLDAIIWLYDFNPDEVLISFEWVCDMLSLEAEQVRRIVARTLHAEILQALDLVAEIIDNKHAQVCAEKISEYVNVDVRKNS